METPPSLKINIDKYKDTHLLLLVHIREVVAINEFRFYD